MTGSSIVEFAIPRDAKHISADWCSVACACPDCLRARDVSMVWPLTSAFVTIVDNGYYKEWEEEQVDWAIEWTGDWEAGFFETRPWFENLVVIGLVGKVRLDQPFLVGPRNTWPTAKYSAWRRQELKKWLEPTNTLDRSRPAKS